MITLTRIDAMGWTGRGPQTGIAESAYRFQQGVDRNERTSFESIDTSHRAPVHGHQAPIEALCIDDGQPTPSRHEPNRTVHV